MSTETDEERLNRIRAVLDLCFQDPNKLESDIDRLYEERKSLAFKLKQIFVSVFGEYSREYKRMFE